MQITHLHLHTSGSELDGAIKIPELVDRIKELGYSACGISDHGTMTKTYEMYKECKAKGIKPIIGFEAYMGEKDDTNRYHTLLIAKNNTGLKNLFKLCRAGYDNFYYKPRIKMKVLEEHKEGLIVTTACLGSELADIWKKNIDTYGYIEYMKEQFGDDFYLEIQPNTTPEQIKYNRYIQQLSKEYGIQTIATCDAHYLYKEDFDAHDTMLCMQVKKKKDDTDRFRFPSHDCYVQTAEEMIAGLTYLDKDFVLKSIENTNKIADKCNVTIEYENLMPNPKGVENVNKKLREECNKGLRRRIPQLKVPVQDVIDRVKMELEVIETKGYSGYFLIVKDFANYCEENDIPFGLGRGSVGGCEIAYILGISEVEPIQYGLFFERFLNPTRNSPPD